MKYLNIEDKHSKEKNHINYAQDNTLRTKMLLIFLKKIAEIKHKFQNINLNFISTNLEYHFHLYGFANSIKNNHINIWLQRFLYSKEELIHFINIPYILSILVHDIKDSLTKKIIYLYQAIIIMSFPIVMYGIQKQWNFASNPILENILYNIPYKFNSQTIYLNKLINTNILLNKDKIYRNIHQQKQEQCNQTLEDKKKSKPLYNLNTYKNNIYISEDNLSYFRANTFLKSNHSDIQRLLNILNKPFFGKKVTFNIQKTNTPEWVPNQNVLLLHNDSKDSSIFANNKKIAIKNKQWIAKEQIAEIKKHKKFLQKLYVKILQPISSKKLNTLLFAESKINITRTSIHQVANNNKNINPRIWDKTFQYTAIFNWLKKYNLFNKYIDQIESHWNHLWTHPTQLIQNILYFLSDGERKIGIKKTLEINHNSKIKIYNNKQSLPLLNHEKKILEKKKTEWIKKYIDDYHMPINYYNSYKTKIFPKKQLIQFIDTFWNIEKQFFTTGFKTIFNIIDFGNIYYKYVDGNYYQDQISSTQPWWNCLNDTIENNQLEHINEAYQRYNFNYLSFPLNQEYFDLTNYLSNRNITDSPTINKIKEINYIPYDNIVYRHIYKEHANQGREIGSLYDNLLQIESKYSPEKQYKKKLNYNNLKLNSKIYQEIFNNIAIKEAQENAIYINKKKYNYSQILFNHNIHLRKDIIKKTDKISKKLWLSHYLFNKLTIDINSELQKNLESTLTLHRSRESLKKDNTEDNEKSKQAFTIPTKTADILSQQMSSVNILKKYNPWIFTSEWWIFLQKIKNTQIPIIKQNISDAKELIYRPQLEKFIINVNDKWQVINNKQLQDLKSIIKKSIEQSNRVLLKELYTSTKKKIDIWNTSNVVKTINSLEWATIAWFITICIIYYQWISIFLGTQYINMWYNFEKMRFLAYPSSNTFLNILVYKTITSPAQKIKLSIYTSKGWIIWLKSKILLFLFKQKFLANSIFSTNYTDFQRTKKNVVVNSLITKKYLSSDYQLWNSHQEPYDSILQDTQVCTPYDGMDYLQKWSRRNARNINLNPINQSVSRDFEYLNDLFFDIEYSRKILNINKSNWYLQQKKPITLSENILLTKRWLLVGPIDAGKAYIIKQLAGSTHLPLVHISLKTIRQATPGIKYNKLKKYNKWIKQLADRGFVLANILELAKMLSPCIFWISDLHEFHANHLQKKQSNKIYDASLLLTILLKIMGTDLLPENKSNITLIGSTNNPALLDPKFVSQHRLDLIINLRKPSFYQRQQIFTNLLNKNKLHIQTRTCFDEIGNRTIGYSIRDITSLINETLLIKLQKLNACISTDVIRLASYRQISKQSASNNTLEAEYIQYKLGKAIIQTILTPYKPLLSITKKHDLWKSRFYYLSNAFLELPINHSTTTELVILNNILNCLAGSAARDAWILDEKTNTTNKIIINRNIKHDLIIASNLIQALLLEFPKQEINKINTYDKQKNLSSSKTICNINFLKNNVHSLHFFERFTSSLYWSYRTERLSLNWTLLFDHIEKPNNNAFTNLSSNIENKDGYSINKKENIEKNLPYERRITKSQQKRITKIQYAFNEIVMENNLKEMGFPWISEYVMNYDALQLSILLLETRTLWIPPVLTPSYSILFFDKDLNINRNMLTKLYITHGEKFKIEKLNPKRMKKEFLWFDSKTQNYDSQDISKNDNITKTFNRENFHYFKQMAKTKSYLEQLQLQPPIYLYQPWTFQDQIKNNNCPYLFDNPATWDNDSLKQRELLIHGILLEIYNFLFKFFLQNRHALQSMEILLLNNHSINREILERRMKNTKLHSM